MASTLGLAAAIGAVGVFLSAHWLVGVGVFVALVGGLLRVAGELQAEDRQAAAEQQVRDGRTRIPIAGIRGVDPTRIGVDPAPPQPILSGGEIPAYLPREIDAELDDAIRAALDGRGRWTVITVGKSKVGKSRALFEALRRRADEHDLDLIAPVDHSALMAMLVPGQVPKVSGRGSILWLDDLEPFVDQGLTVQALDQWHAHFAPCVVAVTFGGKGNALVKSTSGDMIGTLSGEVRRRAREIHLGVTSADEISELPANTSDDALGSIQRHGLAAYLVAGPELATKLRTRRRPGEPECPEGSAVVHAAVDWAWAGRTDPISATTLEESWGDYLPPGSHRTAEGFDVGLQWALEPVAGSIALLEEVEGYRAYDYVVELVKKGPELHAHQPSVWGRALEGATDVQAMSVGLAALSHRRFEDAIAAFSLAAESSDPTREAMATINLGVVQGELDRHEEEIATYNQVIDRFGDAEEESLRAMVRMALFNRGITFSSVSRYQDAIDSYADLVRRFEENPEQKAEVSVARASVNWGIALAALDREEDALLVYRKAIDRFTGSDDPELREAVARAMVNLGVALGELDRHEEAVSVYEQVPDRFGESADVDLRVQVAAALVGRGYSLGELGLDDDSVSSYEEALARSGDSEVPGMREQAAVALADMGGQLRDMGQGERAPDLYRELVDRFGEDDDLEMRRQVALALLNHGHVLGELDRKEEALTYYEQVVTRFEDADDPELLGHVGTALVSHGFQLDEMGRQVESVELYRDLMSRFAGREDEKQRDLVALALVSIGAVLNETGRHRETIEITDEMRGHFLPTDDSAMREQFAHALLNTFVAFTELGEGARALAVCDEIASRFGGDLDPELLEDLEVWRAAVAEGEASD